MRWSFWKRNRQPDSSLGEAPQEPVAHGTDEWAFLRSQPDWDADEMASVHAGEAEPEGLHACSREAWPPPVDEAVFQPAYAPALSTPAAPEVELTDEDLRLSELLHEAMGVLAQPVEQSAGTAEAVRKPNVCAEEVLAALVPEWADQIGPSADVLDEALERVRDAGLRVDAVESSTTENPKRDENPCRYQS